MAPWPHVLHGQVCTCPGGIATIVSKDPWIDFPEIATQSVRHSPEDVQGLDIGLSRTALGGEGGYGRGSLFLEGRHVEARPDGTRRGSKGSQGEGQGSVSARRALAAPKACQQKKDETRCGPARKSIGSQRTSRPSDDVRCGGRRSARLAKDRLRSGDQGAMGPAAPQTVPFARGRTTHTKSGIKAPRAYR